MRKKLWFWIVLMLWLKVIIAPLTVLKRWYEGGAPEDAPQSISIVFCLKKKSCGSLLMSSVSHGFEYMKWNSPLYKRLKNFIKEDRNPYLWPDWKLLDLFTALLQRCYDFWSLVIQICIVSVRMVLAADNGKHDSNWLKCKEIMW